MARTPACWLRLRSSRHSIVTRTDHPAVKLANQVFELVCVEAVAQIAVQMAAANRKRGREQEDQAGSRSSGSSAAGGIGASNAWRGLAGWLLAGVPWESLIGELRTESWSGIFLL